MNPFFLQLLMSCAEPLEPAETASIETEVILEEAESYTFEVDVNMETLEPTIVMPDGSVSHSFDEYAEAVYAIHDLNPQADIDIELGEEISTRIGEELTANFLEQLPEGVTGWGPYYLGAYVLTGGSNSGYTGGCIRQNGSYYAVRLNNGSAQVFDVHLKTWTSGSARCLGVYESVKGWCYSTCSPTRSDVYNSIYTAAVVVGVSAVTAWVIESIAAPLAVSALAL